MTDEWTAYSWIGQPFSGYIQSVLNHGHVDFGHGLDNTSYIEGIWNYLKIL